jgi:hypothetical protein
MATTTKRETKKAAPVAKPAAQPSELSKKAMLIRVTVHRWRPVITDKKESGEIAEKHKAKKGRASARKRLIALDDYAKLRTIEGSLKSEVDFKTLPWTDDGYRVLSSVGYLPLIQSVNQLKGEWEGEFDAVFVKAYKDLIKRQEADLGTMYKAEDYPPVEVVKKKSWIEVSIRPIPSGEDFRCEVGNTEVAKIRKLVEDETTGLFQGAIRTVWERFQTVVSKMAKRLGEYKVTKDGVENSFRDSLVTNIEELLDVVPVLNVTNDPAISDFAQDIRKRLTKHDAEVLRDDEKARKETLAAAEDILAKMSGYLA